METCARSHYVKKEQQNAARKLFLVVTRVVLAPPNPCSYLAAIPAVIETFRPQEVVLHPPSFTNALRLETLVDGLYMNFLRCCIKNGWTK